MISEDFCTDTMKSLVYEEFRISNDDEIFIKAKKFDHILTFDDKELLIEYAPKLFHVTNNTKNLVTDMYELTNLVWEYRLHKSPNYGINYLRDNFPTLYRKDTPRKEKALVDAITTVINLMGGEMVSRNNNIKINDETNIITEGDKPKATEIKELLKIVRDNPNDYIPTKPSKPTVNKDSIRKYLFDLKLEEKSNMIQEFYSKIK